jgi:hypothetical protein
MFLLSTTNRGQTYLENSKITEDIQINGDGSTVYGYNVTSRDGSPLRVHSESGGRFVQLQTPGAPW